MNSYKRNAKIFFCILKMQENKTGHRTKAGRLYDKTGNVRINVTLRHDRATIVAVANQ